MTFSRPGRPGACLAQGIAVATICMANAAPAYAQRLGLASDDGLPVWRVIAAFLICILVAGVAAWVLKARMSGGPVLGSLRTDRRMRMVETLRVKPQVDLHIIECDGQAFLASSSSRGVTILRALDHDAPAPGGLA